MYPPPPYPTAWIIGAGGGQTLTRVVACEQERPCTRCIKRNIGHLCHDEPREHESKKSKSVLAPSTVHDSESQPDLGRSAVNQKARSVKPPSFDSAMGNGPGQAVKEAFDAATLVARSNNPLQLVQPTPVTGIQASALASTMNQCRWLEPLKLVSSAASQELTLPFRSCWFF
jgi:hypothetical protein